MNAVQTFFEMDGHGLYVWLSYGLSLLVVLGHFVYLKRRRNRFELTARARHARNSSTSRGTPADPLLEQP